MIKDGLNKHKVTIGIKSELFEYELTFDGGNEPTAKMWSGLTTEELELFLLAIEYYKDSYCKRYLRKKERDASLQALQAKS